MKKSVLMLTVLTGSVFFYGCTSADTAREMDRAVNMDRCYAPAASGYAVRMNGSRAKAKSGGKMFELDQNRQRKLVQMIRGTQCLITATEIPPLLKNSGAEEYTIISGTVSARQKGIQ